MSAAFTPTGNSATIAVAATTANVAVGGTNRFAFDTIRVMNNGTATAWIAIGAASVTVAAASGIPVPPGGVEVLGVADSLQAAQVYVAVIAAAATGSLYFTPGTGI